MTTDTLAMMARLAAAWTVSRQRRRDPLEHLAWVDSGAPFEQAGIEGFLEGLPAPPDPSTASPDQVERLISRVELGARGSLGDLYMKTVPRSRRHAGGEYYTPGWLVDHVLDRAGFDGRAKARLVDPMCGAGAFLSGALSRLHRAEPGADPQQVVRRVQGMDVNPHAVLMARTAYLEWLVRWPRRRAVRIPVHRADAILDEPPGEFDLVVGNPPWVGWESLTSDARERTLPLWRRHGLFADTGRSAGMQVMLGRARKDLCMLATYTSADRLLGSGGILSFVISADVFKSVGGGAGFRRFVLGDGTLLGVTSVDDFSARAAFPGSAARAAVVTLRKGEPTRYPVAWIRWDRRGTGEHRLAAEPMDPSDPGSPWLTAPESRRAALRRHLGPSPYRARAGAYTGGANGVYWVRLQNGGDRIGDGLARITNLHEAGKKKLRRVSAQVEAELLYPLLRARDIAGPSASPSAWILMAQDPETRRGIDPDRMRRSYPRALAYLERFRGVLDGRRDRGTRSLVDSGAAFYSLFSVSAETMAPWKVVWPRIARRVSPAVVGPSGGRPVVPQETCTFIACASRREACFLAGLIGSEEFNETAAAISAPGTKGFGGPHLLRSIAVPVFDPRQESHRKLADAMEAHMKEGGEPRSGIEAAARGVWESCSCSPATSATPGS